MTRNSNTSISDLPDYEPVTRPHRSSVDDARGPNGVSPSGGLHVEQRFSEEAPQDIGPSDRDKDWQKESKLRAEALPAYPEHPWEQWILRRGHAISFAGVFLFTVVLYFRPYELFGAAWLLSSAFWIATATLLIFVPSQLMLENRITARPREVNLLLVFLIIALLSIVFAISPGDGWDLLSGTFIKVVVMFIVMVNVVRTEKRLKSLIWLGLAVAIYLSWKAIGDFRSGNLTVEGYRIEGQIGGLFDNPNDLALYLATMIPIAVALTFSERGLKKLLYLSCAALMAGAITVTYSRSGFLGFFCGLAVLVWKLGRRNRVIVTVGSVIFGTMFILLAPGNYGARILSSFGLMPDASGSFTTRNDLLWRSLAVALRHPLLGIGMGNLPIVSIHDQVSHNAYTQVAAEMGFVALIIYLMFMIIPLRRLRQIERETFQTGAHRKFFYLAVGIQASLIAYMVSSFFASVAYLWNVYYLIAYAVCLRRIYYVEVIAKENNRLQTAPSAGVTKNKVANEVTSLPLSP
ncbi:MAG TPA: O-antigen ligase family protein [Pyrinomonadaceae bacterium]|nr:O-antigen ligase family protein [Pyrinomonadaceae bacterium]